METDKKTNQSATTPPDQTSGELPLIVATGASAGGLTALSAFFQALPSDSGMAFVIVTHLDPKRSSLLPELLQRYTSMPVQEVTKKTAIKANHVYLNPPDQQLIVQDNMLTVVPFDLPASRRTPIDTLFRSLADSYSNSAAIILSGGGTDGSIGSKFVKENGGLLLVQHPDEAEYDSMPRAVIATGLADLILPVAELASTLVTYHENSNQLTEAEDSTSQVEGHSKKIRSILNLILETTGHNFNRYKHSTIQRRINRRMQLLGYRTLDDYLDLLRQKPDEIQVLFNDFLIGVTSFFRDKTSWAYLAEHVIPDLFANKKAGDNVRVWIAGCATGEEAYTLAFLLHAHAATLFDRPEIQIFASDLSNDALMYARTGLYPEVIKADVSEDDLENFFISEGSYYRVKKEIRDTILFANHNLLNDPPFSRVDLISCRNLFIYLDRDLQKELFAIFHYALQPEGYLFLGNAESAESVDKLFLTKDKNYCIYQKKPWPTQSVPNLPGMLTASHLARQEQQFRSQTFDHFGSAPLIPSPVGAIHLETLEKIGPPSILIDRTYTVLHISESAGRYLRQPGGIITTDLLNLVRPELKSELKFALFKAFEHGRSVVTAPVPVDLDGTSRPVVLSVRPRRSTEQRYLSPPDTEESTTTEENTFQEQLALILFLADETVVSPPIETDGSGPKDPAKSNQLYQEKLITHLQNEVNQLRERLKIGMAEFEFSNESLKLVNEELQSTNEEYRSTTEELETSKEELQSVNEELQTVNDELKNKIAEIQSTNYDLENLIQTTHIPTLFLDNELRIKRYTPSATALFNLMPTDINRPLNHLTHRLDYADLYEDASTVLNTSETIEREIQGDSGKNFLVRFNPYRTKGEQIEGVVITLVDVSKLRETESELLRAERGLETSEARYQHLFESITEGLALLEVITDETGTAVDYHFIEANPAFDTIFKTENGDHQARKNAFEQYGLSQYLDLLGHISTNAEPVTFETYFDSLDAYFLISVSSPEFGKTAVLFTDITEQKNKTTLEQLNEVLEQRVADQLEQLRLTEEAQRRSQKMESLGVMAGGIAHDFNNLLVPLLMYSELGMVKTAEHDQAHEYFKQIYRGAKKASELIRQILAFSHKQRLNMRALHINDLVIDMGDMLTRIIGEDIQIQMKLAENLPPVEGERGQLEQVLMNLIVNAREAMPNGGIMGIETSQENLVESIMTAQDHVPSGSYVVVTISDNGQGMDEATQALIFEPFFSTKETGSGLGLATSFGIIHQHGGYITSESQLNRGTTMRIYLPVSEKTPETVLKPDQVQQDHHDVSETILVVEDEEIVSVLVKEILTAQGYRVIEANSGESALEKVAQNGGEIDLLLTDMLMPGMNGQELYEHIQKMYPAIKVIYMSGYMPENIIAETDKLFLPKPFSGRQLVETVQQKLDESNDTPSS